MADVATRSHDVVRADEVIGVKVINTAKEHLGKIYTIVLHKVSGQTLYVVLESGSILGLGGKLFAVPWNALHYDKQEKAFTLDVSQEMLKNAPGFDKNNWPDMADTAYGKSVYGYYKIKFYE